MNASTGSFIFQSSRQQVCTEMLLLHQSEREFQRQGRKDVVCLKIKGTLCYMRESEYPPTAGIWVSLDRVLALLLSIHRLMSILTLAEH